MGLSCLLVGLGGGLGAIARYLMELIPVPVDFPAMTLLINVLGAAVIGGVSALAGALPLDPRAVLFLKTGACGGFTTFSTFSLETVGLLEERRYLAGGGYALLSVALCLAGVVLGRALALRLVR